MPYRIESLAGEPYRPSNGTEGEMFKEGFCYRCAKDSDDVAPCEILTRTICFDTDEEEYPKEWVHDENGEPTCTAFEQR